MMAVDSELPAKRYAAQIADVLGCWGRVLIFGTLLKIRHAREAPASHVKMICAPAAFS